jgi:aminodeoxyfutalosine synthase
MLDTSLIRDAELLPVADKVLQKLPVSTDEALRMLSTDDIVGLGAIANHVRESINGNLAFYGVNMNLNYTNICELRCPLCAFSRDAGDPDAYLYSLEEIGRRVRAAVDFGIDEVHIVGGLHHELKLDYFTEMLRRIKSIKPDIFIVAFTATEYDYFARMSGLTVKGVMEKFIEAGLGAIPGGGAEIFAEDKRTIIAPGKISGKRWLEIMKTAHGLGLKTNATLLYNHIEEARDIVDHMSRLRDLQDETGGFKTFVPLQFHEENTKVRSRRRQSTGYDDIRLYATARIFLHNIPHIKGLWMYLGEKMAQALLGFGVDDIGATYHYEKVVHSAGAATADVGSEEHLRRLITGAGREPVRAAADYMERQR